MRQLNSIAPPQGILADFADSRTTRVAYDQRTLEIMMPSYQHERLKNLLTTLFEAIATGLNLDFENAGSTTFKREDAARGFEPDTCFYVQRVAAVRGKLRLDLATEPPPDLVIEVDITHPFLALNKEMTRAAWIRHIQIRAQSLRPGEA
jgi:Uma2 family endonuclease